MAPTLPATPAEAESTSALIRSRIPIPDRMVNYVNPSLWGKWDVDFSTADSDNKAATTRLVYLMALYQKQQLTGRILWQIVKSDMEDWPQDAFARIDHDPVKAF